MSNRKSHDDDAPVMGKDPFAENDDILNAGFYGAPAGRVERSAPAPKPASVPKRRKKRKKAPSHYKIVSISLYNEDIAKIDELVQQLKDDGHTKANRSALIRFAIDNVDVSKMPKAY